MQEILLDQTSMGPAQGFSERKMHAKINHQSICTLKANVKRILIYISIKNVQNI